MKLFYWLIGIVVGLIAFEFVLWLLAFLGMLADYAKESE